VAAYPRGCVPSSLLAGFPLTCVLFPPFLFSLACVVALLSTTSVVNANFVKRLSEHCPPGCLVYLQSDVEELQDDMCQWFDESEHFERLDSYEPLVCKTAREQHVLESGGTVHRATFIRAVVTG